jgi:hypothetical protein
MSQAVSPHGSTQVTAARVCTIIAFVLAVVALFVFPVIFGPIAIVLGIVAYVKGDRPLGMWAIVAGVVGLAVGMLLGYLVLTS